MTPYSPLRWVRAGIAALTLGGVLVGPPPVAGQERDAIRPRDGWVERWLDRTPVGRTLAPGVMSHASPARVEPRSFVVHLPAAGDRLLCVTILAQDGRYEANLEYDLAGLGPGRTEFRLPTSHADQLRSEYTEAQLGIRADLKTGCEAEEGAAALASWSPVERGTTFVVFVNSDLATSILAIAESGDELGEAPCTELEGVTTSFNRRCTVPVDWVSGSTELFVRTRQRVGRQLRFDDEPLEIELPGTSGT